ncbi:PREDICTED: probable 28S rRNA (cytosine-C(5))-methyltransferase isoform X1 [Nelumbo nucifera]|uniref:Probable 28S rRNA (Cytosine-C(5))-methyltransferase isoform X1 n=1 Tax=Nelumbo nucifera TaxID=4432 RepID=A0A1U8BCJ7_NELNU|nr:PREDICTED: probable 28S rRNA (cytosine-C(5))-methyltransferase isoform X1 [Nelumbo nucifera]
MRSSRLRPAVAKNVKGGRPSNADRSSYFARREAAKVLRCVLHGDARRRAVASIKSLVYSPCVRNKKATFALVCQTLKHLPILKDVLGATTILNGKWKKQEELIYVITYDILFGQAIVLMGAAEKFLLLQKDALQSALAKLLVKKKVKQVEDLLLLYQTPEVTKPRYVRVNTLKLDVENALCKLERQYMARKDDMVPDLLVLPPGTDLHDHPLVMNGSVFLQGKASSMVAVALRPKPGWEVLDACSAPGNKTVHLAALMKGQGKIIACELNKERVKRLEDTIKRSGATNVEVLHADFLNLNTKDPLYSKAWMVMIKFQLGGTKDLLAISSYVLREVRAILLDPSCSGSGTSADRLDHLLPSYTAGQAADVADTERVNKLAAFQRKALAHALSFPAVERVVYSTCSINQAENEDVIKSVLPLAASHGFQLATPFPQWPRRGFPVFEGSEHLLRTDPTIDMEGFFIALFVRKNVINGNQEKQKHRKPSKTTRTKNPFKNGSWTFLHQRRGGRNSLRPRKNVKNKITSTPLFFTRMSQIMLYPPVTGWGRTAQTTHFVRRRIHIQ